MDPINRVGDFTVLMMSLCGNKDHKYEHKVLKLLQDSLAEDIDGHNYNPNLTLFQIILMKFDEFTINIERNHLSDLDFLQYVNMSVLLGKMLYQNPLLYE